MSLFMTVKLRRNAAVDKTQAPVLPLRSCCVDEIASQHINADCVVHYGRSCLSRVSRIPALLVFDRAVLDVQACATQLLEARAQPCSSAACDFSAQSAGLSTQVCRSPQHARARAAEGCTGLLVALDQELCHCQPVLRELLAAVSPAMPICVADSPGCELWPTADTTFGAAAPASCGTQSGGCGCSGGALPAEPAEGGAAGSVGAADDGDCGGAGVAEARQPPLHALRLSPCRSCCERG